MGKRVKKFIATNADLSDYKVKFQNMQVKTEYNSVI